MPGRRGPGPDRRTRPRSRRAPALIGGDPRLIALDAADGVQRRERRPGDPTWSTPAVAAGTVCIGSEDDLLYAVHT
ncbi:PQQ-binding-like beta-propeller repeat protein [Streptomyces sp. NPDC001833]|uniref:PQQ-binding-like beta-propeller repeat protein n=1 Tax=Streptomyces sp. NPDC001833 TaxID=3154658 RepID=UPI00331D56F2